MFQKACPIWIPNQTHQEKLNTQLLFTAEVPSLKGTVLNLTAVDFYRLTVNGHFVGFGPARTAKGYARVDSYDLSAWLTPGENVLGILLGQFVGRNRAETQLRSIINRSGMNMTNKIMQTSMLIEHRFVDSISMDSLAEMVIPMMMEKLDPHSVYIPKEEMAAIMEQNRVELNRSLPAYGKIAKVEIIEGGFEHTPKQSIKRFLYN